MKSILSRGRNSGTRTAGVVTVLAQLLLPVALMAQDQRACGFGGGMLVWSTVRVEVRDERGRPVARGATLELHDGARRYRFPSRVAVDSLVLGNNWPMAGRFRVRVSKPGYAPAETSGVFVRSGPCGAEGSVTLALVLRERSHAPTVRSVVIQGPGMVLDPVEGGGYPLRVYVDATPGVDSSVIWSVSDTSTLSVSSEGVVRARSIRCRRIAHVIATARADPRRRDRFEIEVGGREDSEFYCISRRDRPDGATHLNLVSGADWSPGRRGISGSLVPFLNDHLQTGIQWSRVSAYPDSRGHAEALATFHIGRHWKSRPHVGVFALTTNDLTDRWTPALGARAGWTYFTSAAVAARAEMRSWKPSRGDVQGEVFLGFDPYVLGGARISRRPPGWGVIDVTLAARAKLTAPRDRSAELLFAPFLTRSLQVGGSLTYQRLAIGDPTARVTASSMEAFARFYAPIESRVTPFAGAFVRSSRAHGSANITTPGVLVGARTHLNRDVALEIVLRRTGHHGAEPAVAGLGKTTLRLGLVAQLRTRGRTYLEMF